MRNEVATGGRGEEVVEREESRLQLCVGGVVFEVTCDVAIVFIATLGTPTDCLRTIGQSQQRRPHLPFNPIWRCNVWVPEWKDDPGGPISRTSRWTLRHGPSNALLTIE